MTYDHWKTTDPADEGAERLTMMIPARKFHIRSYNNHHTVYEIMPRGERAVSPSYPDKDQATQALEVLRTNDQATRHAAVIRSVLA